MSNLCLSLRKHLFPLQAALSTTLRVKVRCYINAHALDFIAPGIIRFSPNYYARHSLLPVPHTNVLTPPAPPILSLPSLLSLFFCFTASCLIFFAAFFFAFSRALLVSVGSILYFLDPADAGSDDRGTKEDVYVFITGRSNTAMTTTISPEHANRFLG